MLAAARARFASSAELAGRVTLVQGQAEDLPFDDGAFDHLSVTYLLRYVDDPAATMRELARVVKPGGRVAMLEFGEPAHEPWHRLWSIYTRHGLPALGRLVSREWAEVGRFLARSIPDFYARHPLATLAPMWQAAGIGAVEVRTMSFGAGVVMWGVRDGPAG
jgi:demethylmenaquinone methyltransferase/2-methoxy-6-polyprenyl-1,4-benzoquinol methylase